MHIISVLKGVVVMSVTAISWSRVQGCGGEQDQIACAISGLLRARLLSARDIRLLRPPTSQGAYLLTLVNHSIERDLVTREIGPKQVVQFIILKWYRIRMLPHS